MFLCTSGRFLGWVKTAYVEGLCALLAEIHNWGITGAGIITKII